jgi:hypothetical protein
MHTVLSESEKYYSKFLFNFLIEERINLVSILLLQKRVYIICAFVGLQIMAYNRTVSMSV